MSGLVACCVAGPGRFDGEYLQVDRIERPRTDLEMSTRDAKA